MAIADKNILITPNTSGILGNQPNVVFTAADSSIGDSAAITLTARPENTGTLSFTGSAGQLFSITNDLSGTIFSVNDVSGIPSLEIDDAFALDWDYLHICHLLVYVKAEHKHKTKAQDLWLVKKMRY